MNYYYIVTYSGFNVRWCSDLLGKRYRIPPSYCHVQKLVDNGEFQIIENQKN